MNANQNLSAVAVVGAGPAGLMAALAAARSGTRVIVCEQLAEPGIRLLATGGGHCNFTNTLATEDFVRRFGAQSRFVAPAIKALDGTRLRLFFEELGVPSHSPDGFHIFPVSDSARSIRDALRQACHKLRVEFRTNCRVDSLQIDCGRVTGIRTAHGLERASSVVLAAGGASYPSLGGGESGFKLARLAGHTILPLCPALVPLVASETWPAALAGVTLPRVAIRLASQVNPNSGAAFYCSRRTVGRRSGKREPIVSRLQKIEIPMHQGEARETAAGSLLFTHKGISGPVTLDISGRVASALMSSASVDITLDLAPDWTLEAWQEHVEKMRKEHGAKTVLSMLASILPAALAKLVLERISITPPVGGYRDAAAASVARLSREQSRRMIMSIKNLPLTITGTEGFGKAMVTKGGVDLTEVCPKTLASKLVRGLFFAGEILDVDGPCGGFNLQWAFSSGALAGQSV